MKILVINCGSSSVKYQLLDMENEKVLAKGKCDRIGETGSGAIGSPFIEYKGKTGNKVKEELALPDHVAAFEAVVRYLTDAQEGVVENLSDISAIGHRVVHGGEYFKESVVITDDVIAKVEECAEKLLAVMAIAKVMNRDIEKDKDLKSLLYEIEFPLVITLDKIERNGMHVSGERLSELHSEYTKRLEDISARVYDECGTEFNISSPKQLADVLYLCVSDNQD